MQIAIVLVHYRQLALTRRCLQTLLAYLQEPFTLYVVDNASTDGSLEILIAEFGERVVFLPQVQNLGFGEGCNQGMWRALEAGAEGVLFLNNDTWVSQDILQPLRQASQAYGHQALLSGQIYTASGEIWFSGGHYSLMSMRVTHTQQVLTRAQATRFITGCLIFLPAEICRRLRGFDARYFLYLEDLDLCLRARAEGFALICLPDVQVFHAVSASTGGSAGLGLYYQNRNRWLIMRRFASAYHWPVFILIYGLGFLKRLLLLAGKRRLVWRALQDAYLQNWGPGRF